MAQRGTSRLAAGNRQSWPLLAIISVFGFALHACSGGSALGNDDDSGGDESEDLGRHQPEICQEVEPSMTDLGGGAFTTETEHYRLHLATGSEEEARRIARMAEMAFFAFAEYFPAEVPNDRFFEGGLYANEDDWAAAIQADGLEPPWGAGGYYHPDSDRAYAYVQPTVYYTRVLVLHELAHQFHQAAKGEDVGDLPFWYVEGIAEFLGRHDWDENCLRLGVMPLGTYEDFPRQAEADLADTEASLASWINTDNFPGSRPLPTAFFRFMETNPDYGESFAAFRQAFDETGGSALDLLETNLGTSADSLNQAFSDFVTEDQQPFDPLWLEWVHRGPDSIRGFAEDVFTAAWLESGATDFSARIQSPLATGGDSGLLVGYEPGGSYMGVLLNAQGGVSSFADDGTGALWMDVATVTPPDSTNVRWTLAHDGAEVEVTINGESIVLARTGPPAAGLALVNTDAIFSDLEWSP